jgi:hypothetical protein
MKIIGIGGEPATGKTSLTIELIKKLSHGIKPQRKKLKSCKFTIYDSARLIVLGVYDDKQTFGGTDRLSMAVQPDAKALIIKLLGDEYYQDFTILFEGDRLFNLSFINWLKSVTPNLILSVLTTDNQTLHQRHINRRDSQSSSWLNGRKTKITRILNIHKDIKLLSNNNYNQQCDNLTIIYKLCS